MFYGSCLLSVKTFIIRFGFFSCIEFSSVLRSQFSKNFTFLLVYLDLFCKTSDFLQISGIALLSFHI